MSKLNCNVVKDILPLYADRVVCDDTRELVEAHLGECGGCRAELAAMRERVVIPLQTDGAETIKKVKRKWGTKQFWKGIAISGFMAAMLVGGFFLLHGYGLPVKAEDVILGAGLECETQRDPVTGEQVPTGEQLWTVNLSTVFDNVRTTSEWVYEPNALGELVAKGVRIYVRRSLFRLPWEETRTKMHGMGIPGSKEWVKDLTITVVCADQEITYSMTEEGLWDAGAVHTAEHCPLVGKGCPFVGERHGE